MKVNSNDLEKYKKDQIERFNNYIIGSKDPSGNTILKVYSRSDEYLVYEIDEVNEAESFRVLIDTQIEKDPKGLINNFEAIKGELATFRSILYKGVHDKSIKHRAAHAVSTALRGDIEKAKNIFQIIETETNEEYKNILFGRLIYLGGVVTFVIICFLLSIFVSRNLFLPNFSSTTKLFLYCSLFSSIGGLLSVCINIKKILFERQLEPLSFYIYGMQRCIIAMICGIASLLLIKGNFIFSNITNNGNNIFSILSIAFISGFSEGVIPNVLKQIEKKEAKDA